MASIAEVILAGNAQQQQTQSEINRQSEGIANTLGNISQSVQNASLLKMQKQEQELKMSEMSNTVVGNFMSGITRYTQAEQSLDAKLEELNAQGSALQSQVFEGESTPESDPNLLEQSERYGLRPDGTAKSTGFLGELRLPGGGVATEYSMQSNALKQNGKRIDFPTLVPTLTPEEVKIMTSDIIPNRKPIPEPIVQKAIKHAELRISQGKSPFFQSREAEPTASKDPATAPTPERIKNLLEQARLQREAADLANKKLLIQNSKQSALLNAIRNPKMVSAFLKSDYNNSALEKIFRDGFENADPEIRAEALAKLEEVGQANAYMNEQSARAEMEQEAAKTQLMETLKQEAVYGKEKRLQDSAHQNTMEVKRFEALNKGVSEGSVNVDNLADLSQVAARRFVMANVKGSTKLTFPTVEKDLANFAEQAKRLPIRTAANDYNSFVSAMKMLEDKKFRTLKEYRAAFDVIRRNAMSENSPYGGMLNVTLSAFETADPNFFERALDYTGLKDYQPKNGRFDKTIQDTTRVGIPNPVDLKDIPSGIGSLSAQ